MSEINLEFLLGAMPTGVATLYRVLIQLIPAPSAAAPNLGGRQIEMAELARLTDFSERWVIELMRRLEKKNFIRTEGGSGAVKWIWLLPLGMPRLGKPFPTELTQKEKTSPEPIPGKAKAPQAAAQPKRRRQETAQNAKTGASVQVAPPVEKPAEVPKRRQKAPLPSTPPTDPSPKGPVLAITVIPPPPPAPADPVVPATRVTPARSTAPGGPAAGNRVVAAVTLTPAPSVARGPAPGKPVVPATRVTPARSTAPGDPAPGNPAAMVTPPSSTAPAIPAKPIPPAPRPRPDAPIEDLVAYVCSLPVTSDLIWSLKTAVGNEHRLRIALQILCRGSRRYEHESDLKSAIRTALNDYL